MKDSVDQPAATGIKIAIELGQKIKQLAQGIYIMPPFHRFDYAAEIVEALIKGKRIMLLTIDIGNTNLTIGLYENEKLGARWRLATDHERMPDEYGLQILNLLQHSGCSPMQLAGICLSSVVPPLTSRVVRSLRELFTPAPSHRN